MLPWLPHESATALYRIAQEALTNVFRHSVATDTWLKLTAEDNVLRFVIEDNGCGFDTLQRQTGLGLLGIQERAEMLRCSVTAQSRSDDGTTIIVAVPVHV